MRSRKSILATLAVVAGSWCSGGCIDAVPVGIQSGVESALATVIETFLVEALTPGEEAAE